MLVPQPIPGPLPASYLLHNPPPPASVAVARFQAARLAGLGLGWAGPGRQGLEQNLSLGHGARGAPLQLYTVLVTG